MTQPIKSLSTAGVQTGSNGDQGIMLMGSAILGINIILMAFTALYWTSSNFHQYLTGQPL